MAIARTTSQKKQREAEKSARVATVRAARGTNTMADAAAVLPDKPLTEKQKAFAVARARGESIPNAMALAGYNEQPSYGYRMDKMPNVRALMQQEQALYAEAAQMSRKKVIDMHLEAYDAAKLLSEPATMVAAAREIGKICGLYEPQKVQIDISGSVQHEIHRLEAMSDTELLEVLTQGLSPPGNPDTSPENP